MARTGQTFSIPKTYNAEYRGTKITDLAKKHIREIAANFKKGDFTIPAQQSKEQSALYRKFLEARGGTWNGPVTEHSLADIKSRANNFLGNEHITEFNNLFVKAYKDEADRLRVDLTKISADTGKSGSSAKITGSFNAVG
jgi:hypothetical protein